MRRPGLLPVALLALAGSLPPTELRSSALPAAHERLRVRNDFKTAEEVVRYYCSRDASGFVWSGLLDTELKAFTLWPEPPAQDTFLIARSYEVRPGKLVKLDETTVEVFYELVAMGDANGTRSPVQPIEKTVRFNLKRVSGSWKIARPSPSEIQPIVLESKFQ